MRRASCVVAVLFAGIVLVDSDPPSCHVQLHAVGNVADTFDSGVALGASPHQAQECRIPFSFRQQNPIVGLAAMGERRRAPEKTSYFATRSGALFAIQTAEFA